VLAVLVGGVIFLNNYLKNEVENALEKEFSTSELSYDEISIDVLARSATIKNLQFKEGTFQFKSREANLSGFSYSEYLQNDDITIGSVRVYDPEIVINKSDTVSGNSGTSDETGERNIRVEKFTVTGGSIKIVENDTSSNDLYASIQDIQISEILINDKRKGGLLPFHYNSMDLKSDSIYYDMNSTHYMQGKLLRFKNDDLSIEDLSIIPKYSKVEFDRIIPYEQDWIALKIDAVNLAGLQMQKEEEQALFNIPVMSIENAHLQIYRNKMLKEDTRIKPMYSEMLRELDFKIRLDSVNISGSYIEYEENVLEDRPAGKLSFHNVNAFVKDITNRKP
jgi:hypothetical protein